MVRRKPNAVRKLAGWAILAGVGVLIVVVFVVTHAVTSTSPKPASAQALAEASATPPPASSGSSAESSSEAVVQASSDTAAAPSSAPVAQSAASSAPAVAVIDPDAMDQATREALLTRLIRQGIFTGVQAIGSPPKVAVTPLFQGLDPDLQRQFIATVYSYVNNGKAGVDPLQVIDATTGKLVGSYTAADGFKLL